jgi:MFS family permease
VFSAAYKRYALGVVTAVYMLNLVDRGLMILLLQPIKLDLALSDTQLGLLTGIAFGLLYATLGVPIARWADRGNRPTITSLAIALWGLTVMACVLVTSYVQLVFARVAAAIGEAGCKPPTYSLVGDYFPSPAERTRAMAVYFTGNPLSSLFTFVLGGWLNELYGWRMTFLIMGIPGLVLALLVKLTIVEPRTRGAAAHATKPPAMPMRAVLSMLWKRRSCRHLGIALILLYTKGLGLGPWYAAFMMRSHGMGTAELGLYLGLIFGLGGIGGSLLGGYIANRWFATDERAQVRAIAVTAALTVPCFIAFLTLPTKHQALAVLLPLMIISGLYLGPTYALLQRLVPDETRATMLAIVMLLANLIAFGAGPLAVGALSDALAASFGSDALRYAMLMMSCVGLWAAYHFWLVSRTVREDLVMVAR